MNKKKVRYRSEKKIRKLWNSGSPLQQQSAITATTTMNEADGTPETTGVTKNNKTFRRVEQAFEAL